jgi:hypothetical protein
MVVLSGKLIHETCSQAQNAAPMLQELLVTGWQPKMEFLGNTKKLIKEPQKVHWIAETVQQRHNRHNTR